MTRARVVASDSATGIHPPAPANLFEVIRGFTAADWREVLVGLALIAPTIASAAALILMLEPARP